VCRIAKEKGKPIEGAWASLKKNFDDEVQKCCNANYEFSTLSASYAANIEFMSYQWLVDNVAALFPANE
jgi:hypothetical protein